MGRGGGREPQQSATDILFGQHRRSAPDSFQVSTPDGSISYWTTERTISFTEARDQGLLHRQEGPAVEWKGGSKEWWLDGQLHRAEAEGPAIILRDADYEEIEYLTEALGEYMMDGLNLYVVNGKLHRDNGPAYFDDDQMVQGYYQDGQLHREDGPSLVWVYDDGSSFRWHRHGQLHREDGPALERTHFDDFEIDTASKAWFVNGQLHRDDGPAIDVPEGVMFEAEEVTKATGLGGIEGPTKLYYRNGQQIELVEPANKRPAWLPETGRSQ